MRLELPLVHCKDLYFAGNGGIILQKNSQVHIKHNTHVILWRLYEKTYSTFDHPAHQPVADILWRCGQPIDRDAAS